MNLNKCSRCGCFFESSNNVCPNCQPKDAKEMNELKCFFEENPEQVNINSLSASTGISVKNINRFLSQEQFSSLSKQVLGNDGNIGIGL